MDNDAAFLIKIFITDTYIKVLLMQVSKHSHVQVDVSDSISRNPFANHCEHSPVKAHLPFATMTMKNKKWYFICMPDESLTLCRRENE